MAAALALALALVPPAAAGARRALMIRQRLCKRVCKLPNGLKSVPSLVGCMGAAFAAEERCEQHVRRC
jgi:hypothetical protein